ncbi:MAG: abortive phage infection protein [Clostridia bacterium]|nr:abortive phage infection protein [Clostridia bacterium]
MDNIKKIKDMIEENDGIIYTSQLTDNKMHRQYLKELENQEYIEKVSRGVYAKKGKEVNEFFLLQQRFKNGIFSHNTALYFWGLTDRTPLKIDMTFMDNVRVKDETIFSHYRKRDFYYLGITELKLEDGTIVKLYNLERTICDIIRDRNKEDTQIFKMALNGYMKRKDKNLLLLYRYAKIYGIEGILRQYMEVLE